MLTFKERVAYQRAIEDVYWRHRIWPKENPDPAIARCGNVSGATRKESRKLSAKVSSAGGLICIRRTTEQLQAELDRMAQHTKRPEVLREIFGALDNDPFVIAECLARHVTRSMSADKNLPQSWLLKAKPKCKYSDRKREHASLMSQSVGCRRRTWTPTTHTNAPSARNSHTAVWTGSEMIIWGGWNSPPLNTGGRYHPTTDSWTLPASPTRPPPGKLILRCGPVVK